MTVMVIDAVGIEWLEISHCGVIPLPQVSAVQVSPGEILVECHNTGLVQPIKSDIHRGIFVTKVGCLQLRMLS